MTVAQHIQQLRHLVLEHPHAANLPLVLHPHGVKYEQTIESTHLNLHETKVVLEAQR